MGVFKSFFVNCFTEALNKLDRQNSNIYNKPNSIEVLKHSKKYSDLLDIYIDSAKQNINMKKWFKIIFFGVTIGILVAVVVFFGMALRYAFNCFDKYDNLNIVTIEAIISVITIMIPAISSLLVAFIKIPEIIAQYLFYTKEDESMNLIIKNIQDYDTAMFKMEQRLDELLIDNKDQDITVEDDGIDDSPIENAN